MIAWIRSMFRRTPRVEIAPKQIIGPCWVRRLTHDELAEDRLERERPRRVAGWLRRDSTQRRRW
jgi:hypothetical protein